MKTVKNILLLIMSASLLLAFVGCGDLDDYELDGISGKGYKVYEGTSMYSYVIYTIRPNSDYYEVKEGTSRYSDVIYTIRPNSDFYEVYEGTSRYSYVIYTIRPIK